MNKMSDNYVVSEIEKDYIVKLLEQGKRMDGRALNEHRPIEYELNYIEKAEGSAVISLGNTKIIVGIKATLGSPFPDTPNQGVITTSAELSPVASPYFESGPPSDDATILARVTDRAIRESHAIDLEKLCLIPEKLVWIIFIDIYVLNYDGSLFDACTLGSIAALATAKIPKVKVNEDGTHEILDEVEPIPISHYPITVTTYLIGKDLLIDPSIKEERISEAYLVLAFDENDNVVATQKGKLGTLKPNQIMPIVHESLASSKNLRSQLMKAIEDNR